MAIEHSKLENLSDRLNYALQLTGTKKADLAKSISVKPQVIQFLCSSKTQSSRFTFEIATALGLNTRWLATGQGAMFVADDPKQQFLSTYRRIPLLSFQNLKEIFINNKPLEEEAISIWLPLETNEKNVFAIKMFDCSMEPFIPLGSNIFINICDQEKIFQENYKYIFAYLKKLDTFVIRELVKKSDWVLKPKNQKLFKEIKVLSDINLLGIVTDCFWHVTY